MGFAGNDIPPRRKQKAQNGNPENPENLENPDSDELGTWVRNISYQLNFRREVGLVKMN